MESLESRLAALERSNRRLRAGLLAVVLAGTGAIGLGATRGGVPEVLRASRFEVVNGKGEIRASLSAYPDGASLALLNRAGIERASLGLDDKSDAALVLAGHGGQTLVRLEADQTSSLTLYDARRTRVALSVGFDGCYLSMDDETGRTRAFVDVPNGRVDGTFTPGSTSLVLRDHEGRAIFEVPKN